jgi:hypothetical protein
MFVIMTAISGKRKRPRELIGTGGGGHFDPCWIPAPLLEVET